MPLPLRRLLLTSCLLIPLSAVAAVEDAWEHTLRSMLAAGQIPLIDLEASLKQEDMADYFPDQALRAMDELGVALIAFDGYQAEKDGRKGYRWSDYLDALVAAHPGRFIATANGGTNNNWLQQKGGAAKHFIDQMEGHIRNGDYRHMGELEFRHYPSSSQCRSGRLDRDETIPIDSENGHRLFALGAETGVPFGIHYEAEDALIPPLEKMLSAYPRAKVVWAHFAQLRKPELQAGFTAETARRLLHDHPNLYFDLANGDPDRSYPCGNLVGDTAIWQRGRWGQTSELDPAWRQVLIDYQDRFVFASDYGGGRPPFPRLLEEKVHHVRNILSQLPEEARHAIAYRNAWKLLTNKDWRP